MDKVRHLAAAGNSPLEPIEIRHSLRGAVGFGLLVFTVAASIVAMLMYLQNQSVLVAVPFPVIFAFSVIFLVILLVVKTLFRAAGKVAICIGPEGVKFDCYKFIGWDEMEKVYFIEHDDGGDCLWLKVKEGVEFLPSGPRPLIWLARKTGLHQSIDISGYGTLSMTDKAIYALLDAGIEENRNNPLP